MLLNNRAPQLRMPGLSIEERNGEFRHPAIGCERNELVEQGRRFISEGEIDPQDAEASGSAGNSA